MKLNHLRSQFEEHLNNVSNEEFAIKLKKAGIKSAYQCYPFTYMSKWERLKLWIQADVPYLFMNLWWKITGKYQ